MSDESLKDLLPKMLKNLEEKHRSPSTILAYRADVEQLIEFLQEKNMAYASQITSKDVANFRDELLARKYTAKTVSRKLNAVKTFFRWLINYNGISFNPAEDVSHPKIESSLPKFLSPIEYRALRDVARDDERISTIVELILQTGLRISEVANLKVDNVRKDSLVVEPHATQPKREVPLNAPAKEALEKYLKIRPNTDSDFLFVSKNGKPLAVRNIRAAIDRYFNKAEMSDFSVNDLRTTFLVENLKAKVDLVYLSQIVGHKRLSTTERYLQLAGLDEPGKKQELVEL